MAYGDSYQEYRRIYSDISGHLALAAAGTTTTLVTNVNASDTIFIQIVRVYVVTDAAQTATFRDSNGTPKVIARLPSSPGVDTPWIFDFGPRGVPLTAAKDFILALSAAGLALNVEWEGYQKRTEVASA